jgi:hypothetical protein
MIIVYPLDLTNLKSRDPVTLQCEECGILFERAKHRVMCALKPRWKNKLRYCSKQCQSNANFTQQEVSCLQCNKIFFKTRSQVKFGKNNFCSSSCSATYNNTHCLASRRFGPKRTKEYSCAVCGTTLDRRRKFCSLHDPCELAQYRLENGNTVTVSISKKTLQEIKYGDKSNASNFGSVRCNARMIAHKLGLHHKCLLCNYTKHITICHVKSVCTFDLSTPVREVNSPSNLIGLCNNHHWELDHHLLSTADLLVIETRFIPVYIGLK